MFDRDPNSLAATLSEMEHRSRIKSNFDQGEAKRKLAEYVGQDRRFDSFDLSRLIERVADCRSNGATLDLDDPFLQRGGERRPLDQRR
jgi:hypothetical protein